MPQDDVSYQIFNLETMSGVYPGSRTAVMQRIRLLPLAAEDRCAVGAPVVVRRSAGVRPFPAGRRRSSGKPTRSCASKNPLAGDFAQAFHDVDRSGLASFHLRRLCALAAAHQRRQSRRPAIGPLRVGQRFV
ncbi:MAG: hypothetical protein R2856_03485 [Caldilineaceae bacterium]